MRRETMQPSVSVGLRIPLRDYEAIVDLCKARGDDSVSSTMRRALALGVERLRDKMDWDRGEMVLTEIANEA